MQFFGRTADAGLVAFAFLFAVACSGSSDPGPNDAGGRDAGLERDALSDADSDGSLGGGGRGAPWVPPVSTGGTPNVFECPTDASVQCTLPAPGYDVVGPIIGRSCVGYSCHRAYSTFEAVHASRVRIRERLQSCSMYPINQPDWALLMNWVTCGAPLEGGVPFDEDASVDAETSDGGSDASSSADGGLGSDSESSADASGEAGQDASADQDAGADAPADSPEPDGASLADTGNPPPDASLD